MRRAAWGLLLLFVFAIPWEYSLDLGEPLGNIARIRRTFVVAGCYSRVLQNGRLRNPGALQWLVLALYLWFCCSYFWTIDPQATHREDARVFPGDDDCLAGVGVRRGRA